VAFLDASFGEAAVIVLALVMLESVLSFDNAAILAALSRRLPLGEGRRRALNYGLAIAYVLRIAAILSAVWLIKYPAFLAVGGAYLVFLLIKHFSSYLRKEEHHEGHKTATGKPIFMRLGLTAFGATILQIGVVDLAFALDQVVTAVGITREYILIIIASTIGLIALRVLAPYISRLMDWLPSLEHIAYVAVGFVGVILLAESIGFTGGFHFVHHGEAGDHPLFIMPTPIKIGITLALFLVPIVVKLAFKWPKSTSHHATVEETIRESKHVPSVDALHHATKETKASKVKRPKAPKAPKH
jgi:YkoY family integral membrane protein